MIDIKDYVIKNLKESIISWKKLVFVLLLGSIAQWTFVKAGFVGSLAIRPWLTDHDLLLEVKNNSIILKQQNTQIIREVEKLKYDLIKLQTVYQTDRQNFEKHEILSAQWKEHFEKQINYRFESVDNNLEFNKKTIRRNNGKIK